MAWRLVHAEVLAVFPVAPGGGADKRGGRYESRWTVWRGACPVLSGTAEAITVEALRAAGVGIEFRLHYVGYDEVHQVKRQRAAGSWTINALNHRDDDVVGKLGTIWRMQLCGPSSRRAQRRTS